MAVDGLILNRELVAGDVPRYAVLELGAPDGGYRYAWSRIWSFVLTFDPEEYSRATGSQLNGKELAEGMAASLTNGEKLDWHLAELRTVLHRMYWEGGQGQALPMGSVLVEAVLDAIYARLAGGKRPSCDPGPYEPALGTPAGNVPGTSGQHRFWFTPRSPSSREQLYDRVAGILLRGVDHRVYVSALYLYPPAYPLDRSLRATAIFSLLLQRRRSGSTALIDDQYQRLTRLVVNALAEPDEDRHPT